MTQSPEDSPGGVPYEIVIPGAVGLTVRTALLPIRAVTEHSTVLHTRLAPGRGLTDLVAALGALGVRVTSVALLD